VVSAKFLSNPLKKFGSAHSSGTNREDMIFWCEKHGPERLPVDPGSLQPNPPPSGGSRQYLTIWNGCDDGVQEYFRNNLP
jgi:hypothetical protein